MLESEPRLSPPPNPLHPPLFPLTHAPSNSLPLGLFLHTAHTHVHKHTLEYTLSGRHNNSSSRLYLERIFCSLSLSPLSFFFLLFASLILLFFLPSLAQFATSNATQCAHTHTHTLAFSLFLSLSLLLLLLTGAHTHTLVLVERKR